MFRTKFKSINHDGSFIVIYKKWCQLSWNMLAVNNDPYRFPNEEAVEYMVKCLEEAGL